MKQNTFTTLTATKPTTMPITLNGLPQKNTLEIDITGLTDGISEQKKLAKNLVCGVLGAKTPQRLRLKKPPSSPFIGPTLTVVFKAFLTLPLPLAAEPQTSRRLLSDSEHFLRTFPNIKFLSFREVSGSSLPAFSLVVLFRHQSTGLWSWF